MDYKKLLTNISTAGNLEIVCENWYARLNRLKEVYVNSSLTDAQKDKCVKLISEMIDRMMRMSALYIRVKNEAAKPLPPGFTPGGVMHNPTDL